MHKEQGQITQTIIKCHGIYPADVYGALHFKIDLEMVCTIQWHRRRTMLEIEAGLKSTESQFTGGLRHCDPVTPFE